MLHPSIQDALQQAVIQRNKKTLLKKKQENEKLGALQYHRMKHQFNNTKFIKPKDADTTKASIYYTRTKFQR